MIGIYFSGTGNSKYALERFLCKYDETAKAYALEDGRITELIKENEEIVFSYPVGESRRSLHHVLSLCQCLSEAGDHSFGKKGHRAGYNRKVFIVCFLTSQNSL